MVTTIKFQKLRRSLPSSYPVVVKTAGVVFYGASRRKIPLNQATRLDIRLGALSLYSNPTQDPTGRLRAGKVAEGCCVNEVPYVPFPSSKIQTVRFSELKNTNLIIPGVVFESTVVVDRFQHRSPHPTLNDATSWFSCVAPR